MSGIEVLGVLASIAQLLDCSLKLSSLVGEVYSRVREAPERVVMHTAQLGQLVDTARLIERSSDLQKPIVNIHLKATLAEAARLQRILERMIEDYTKGSRKKRILKAVKGAGERLMLNSFERLEKEKSALILCISFIHTETLGTIRDGVGELIPKMDTINRSVTAIGRQLSASEAEKQSSCPTRNQLPKEQPKIATRWLPIYEGNMELALVEHESQGTARRDIQPTNNNQPTNNTTPEDSVPGSITEPTSSKDSIMVVGGYNEETPRDLHVVRATSEDDSILIGGHWGGSGNHIHVKPTSTGRSLMILGNVKGDSTVYEIERTFQRMGRSVK